MGARSKRIERVTRVYPDICAQLTEYTKDVHQGATFHGGRSETETCWYATPFVATRDGDALEASNFRVIMADLQKRDPDGVQDLHFGHWAFGWYDRIYVRKDHPVAIALVRDWTKALTDYPIADESDYSELEYEMNHPADGECYSDDPDCCPKPEHSDYPHEPGRLYDCPACEAECHCSHLPGNTQCIFCAELEN